MAAADVIDYRAAFERVPSPLAILRPDLIVVDASQGYLDLIGWSRDALVGRNLLDTFPWPSDNTRMLQRSVNKVVETAEQDSLPVLAHPTASLEDAGFIERFWSCSHTPIRNSNGDVAFVLQSAADVTDMHRVGGVAAPPGAGLLGSGDHEPPHQAGNVALLAETAQLRNLFMQAPSFMCLLRGADHTFELANTAFADLVGHRDLVGRTLRDAIPEVNGQIYLDLLDKVYRTGEAFVGKQMRAQFKRASDAGLEDVYINFVFQPVVGDDGRVVAIFVDGNDVTDHVRAEKSQTLLVRELHHRVRNTLATVQGVMNSTARTAETIEDYQWAFSGRISSLARTHSLLTEEIQQYVSFSQLLHQEIGVYAEGETADRIVLDGPEVELPSQLAVPLGMTIHELATNAFRHGALSLPSGRVTVTWTIVQAGEKRILTCRWIESGGPAVAPPVRHGFGSMILTRVLATQIGAVVEAAYRPEGFELSAEIPLDLERM